MSNLTRYHLSQNRVETKMVVAISGEYVKFDDIKEFLKPSHNTPSKKLPCENCSGQVRMAALNYVGANYCSECGRQLHA